MSAWAAETPEQLLGGALINRYLPVIHQHFQGLFQCQRVINLKRLGTEREFAPRFQIIVQLVTFEGAHKPPYDLVTLTIVDTPLELKVIDVQRKHDISRTEFDNTARNTSIAILERYKNLPPPFPASTVLKCDNDLLFHDVDVPLDKHLHFRYTNGLTYLFIN